MNVSDNIRMPAAATAGAGSVTGNTGNKKKTDNKLSHKELTISDNISVGENHGDEQSFKGKIKSWVNRNIHGDKKNNKWEAQRDFERNLPQYAAIGACAGGAIGTGIGLVKGYESVKNNTVELQWKTNDIKDPVQTGFSHYAVEDYHYETDRYYAGTDSEGNAQYNEVSRKVTDGWWHHYSPTIKYHKVGTFETPEYKHSNNLTPISGGMLGLIGGSAAGGIVGVAVAFLQKLIQGRG